MAKSKRVDQIKHGPKVMDAIKSGAIMHDDIRRATGLDMKTLQTCLNRLLKSGHIDRDGKSWFLTESSDGEWG